MLPRKLVALTHCLKSSIQASEWDETKQLLVERENLIGELASSPVSLSEKERVLILDADGSLQQAVEEKKSTIVDRLRKLGKTRRVRSTYHVD